MFIMNNDSNKIRSTLRVSDHLEYSVEEAQSFLRGIYVYEYVYEYKWVYLYIYIYIYMSMYICVYLYVHIHEYSVEEAQ
jgi:hypothetical protein